MLFFYTCFHPNRFNILEVILYNKYVIYYVLYHIKSPLGRGIVNLNCLPSRKISVFNVLNLTHDSKQTAQIPVSSTLHTLRERKHVIDFQGYCMGGVVVFVCYSTLVCKRFTQYFHGLFLFLSLFSSIMD